MPEESRKFVERRRGPDLLIRWIQWSVFIGWMIIVAIVIVIAEAQPEKANFFDKLFHNKLRTYWNLNLLQYAFYLLFFLFLLCAVGFVFNLRRKRRKSDRFSVSLILLGLGSLAGMVIYVLNV